MERNKMIKCIFLKIILSLNFLQNVFEENLTEKNNPVSFSQFQDDKNVFESNAWRPIRIVADYSNMKIKSEMVNAVSDILEKHVFTFFRSFTNVTGSHIIEEFTSTSCEDFISTPSSFANKKTVADLLIFIKTEFNDNQFLASSMTCKLRKWDNRPVIGMIILNEKHLKFTQQSIEALSNTLIHEMLHILVFSPTLFAVFQANNPATKNVSIIQKNGDHVQFQKVITPKVVETGKKHFNCSTLDGILLENNGDFKSKNTHWNKLLLGNEIMTSEMKGKIVVSNFTLSLMEDSGWYLTDYNKAERLRWGENKGCDFLESNCDSIYSEFCSENLMFSKRFTCSEDYKSKRLCQKTDFTGDCFVYDFIFNLDCNSPYSLTNTLDSYTEYHGLNSRCFEIELDSVETAGCFDSVCLDGALEIRVNNELKICTKENEILSFSNFKIKCPKIVNFCSEFNNKCKNDCNGFGKCTYGGCVCEFFKYDEDCSSTYDCEKSNSLCQLIQLEEKQKNSNTRRLKIAIVLFVFSIFEFITFRICN